MTDLEQQAIVVISESENGVLQSELWKILGVDSRKCSRIVKKLLDMNRVERIEHRQDGIKTYRLIACRGPVDPNLLLAGADLIPCVACDLECNAEECTLLLDWMYQLAICEALPEGEANDGDETAPDDE
ncbi:MAG: Lrp/AsnC family transcriptional regulator [Euryarchaeota archaeon]|nr:Lrp/AsnC family transcriptional regulator [Euryarchaeota archaeon]